MIRKLQTQIIFVIIPLIVILGSKCEASEKKESVGYFGRNEIVIDDKPLTDITLVFQNTCYTPFNEICHGLGYDWEYDKVKNEIYIKSGFEMKNVDNSYNTLTDNVLNEAFPEIPDFNEMYNLEIVDVAAEKGLYTNDYYKSLKIEYKVNPKEIDVSKFVDSLNEQGFDFKFDGTTSLAIRQVFIKDNIRLEISPFFVERTSDSTYFFDFASYSVDQPLSIKAERSYRTDNLKDILYYIGDYNNVLTKNISPKLNETNFYVDNEIFQISNLEYEGLIYVNVREFFEALGCFVEYDSIGNIVYIDSKQSNRRKILDEKYAGIEFYEECLNVPDIVKNFDDKYPIVEVHREYDPEEGELNVYIGFTGETEGPGFAQDYVKLLKEINSIMYPYDDDFWKPENHLFHGSRPRARKNNFYFYISGTDLDDIKDEWFPNKEIIKKPELLVLIVRKELL